MGCDVGHILVKWGSFVRSTLAAAFTAAVAVLAVLTAVGASAETANEQPYSDNSVVNPENPTGSGHGGPY